MDTPAIYDGFTVTALNKTNAATTNYYVTYTSKIPLENGDLFYITFPRTIRTPKEPECLLGDGLDVISCTSETGRIVVTFRKLKSGYVNVVNKQVSFTLIGIKNAPTMVSSDDIESYRTSGKYQMISKYKHLNAPTEGLRITNTKFSNLNDTEVSISQSDENFA